MVEVTEKNELEDVIAQCDSEGRVLILQFSAPWCKLCQPMHEFLIGISEQVKGRLRKVNTPDAEELVSEYEITKLPVVIVFANGKIARRVDGYKLEEVEKGITTADWEVKGVQGTEDF